MLTKEQIAENKKRFLELISSIKIEGANIEGFLRWVEHNSDFFIAPASAKYHCDYEGGLCEHSLNVYDALVKLVEQFASHFEFHQDEVAGTAEEVRINHYSEDTIKIVALLHDISKANFYEQYERNVKNEAGEWVKVKDYKTREADNRFIYGSHEQNAEYIAHTFFPLTVEEGSAILHHHAGMSWDSAKDDIGTVYGKYPLATLLHVADMIATFTMENRDEQTN